jgi:hypothetical protein
VKVLPAPPPSATPILVIMDDGRFGELCGALTRESFSRDRLRVLGAAIQGQYFQVAQVQRLLTHFEFSSDRLEAARLLRSHIADGENTYKLYSSFEFSSDKDRLKQILGS